MDRRTPVRSRPRPAREPGLAQGIMLLLPVTMSVMGIAVLTPVVHLILRHFEDVPNHDYLVQGGVLTMPAMWILLFSPVAGWIADRFGRRRILILSMIVYAFVGIAPAFLDNLYAIVLSRVGVGVCESIVLTVSTTLICDYYKGRVRERWLASQTAVASLSALGIIYLGGVLGAEFGWRGPFYLYFYSLVLVPGVATLIWEPTPTIEEGSADAVVHEDRIRTLATPRMLGIYAITLVASVCFYVVITKNAEVLGVLGVSDPAEIGRLTMIASVGVPLGSLCYGVAGRLPIGWVLCIDFALMGLGFYWMGRAHGPVSYAWGTFTNQIGCGMVLPTLLVWATRGLAHEIRGRANGVWQATFAIGQFLSGMLVTFLAKQANSLLAILVIFGVVALAAAAVAALTALVTGGGIPQAASPERS